METEQARHETEESLILAQFDTSQNISDKLQNGGQTSEGDSLQITGDANWSHYKPSTDANTLKRQRENCNRPASVQGLFDQGSHMMNGELMNGELKNALQDQSLLHHQPKKPRINSEFKGNNDMSSSLGDNFPELANETEYECNTPQTEISLDKSNCNFPNGDIFSLPRNKQVPIPNGAVSSLSTIERTPDDLLEKTLSQYYPEQVSIAQTPSGPQVEAVNGSHANKVPSEGAQPLSSNSGSPNAGQIPSSVQSGESDDFKSVNYVVNGCSNNFGEDNQQQQQQQQYQRQTPSYSGQKLSEMIASVEAASSSQEDQNGPRCYPDGANPTGIYAKANQEFDQKSFLDQNTPLRATETGGYEYPNSGSHKMGQSEELGSGQHQHHGNDRGNQYGSQNQALKQNAGNPYGPDNKGSMGPNQPPHAELENGMETTSQQRTNSLCSTPHQRGWLELNSHSQQHPASAPSSQANEQGMWGGFPANGRTEHQTSNLQVHGQMLEPNSVQRFQTQEVFRDSSQRSNSSQQPQQDCLQTQTNCAPAQHSTAPEWKQTNSQAPQMHQSLPQKNSDQCNFTLNQQVDSPNHTRIQSEHFCEDPDLQDILSPGFIATQQQHQHCHLQRPLSHPPQFERQQLKSPNYRPRSQPQPGQQQLTPTPPLRISSTQSHNQTMQNNDHEAFSFNSSTEMQQPQKHQMQYPQNVGTSNLKQYQSQTPNNPGQQLNHADIQTSSQSQPHLAQGMGNQHVSTQMYPKVEQQLKAPCAQFQRGPPLPLRPAGTHGDFQRHAALRMHLLQKQERQGLPHSPQTISDTKYGLRAVKMENGPRFQLPGPQLQEQYLQMQDGSIGRIQVKQENQQSMCEQSKRQGNILASMEQSLKQYQLSPVFEKKSLAINSSNKVKVESSGPVTILSTNTDLNGVESVASADVPLKKPPVSTPKKENLLQSFMESPLKLLDNPIKNLLDTPMKTQYDIASCHCVGEYNNFGPEN